MKIRGNQSGMSLMEVLAALAIVGVMIVGTMTVVSSAHQLTRHTVHKEFATQKAISILEELKTVIQTSEGTNVTSLDRYDNGTSTVPLLTAQGALDDPATTQPDDPVSGNIATGPTTWLYERRVTVRKLPGLSNDVRLVNVQVYQNTPGGQVLQAEVASVLRTIVDNMPPTQVYDVYALALENVPGWWVYMSNVVPFVKTAIDDLQARNPGLIFRTHWITALAYGRDQQYRPYVNETLHSWNDIPYVYFYPGKMPPPPPAGTCICGDDYYYPSFFFNGLVNIDGTTTNGASPENPFPYTLADQYNHAMRFPDEFNLYSARKNDAEAQGLTPPEMTWRLLMEDMFRSPEKYTNALLINLHGELMPFPPMRNYSDAAKSPGSTFAPDLRGIRAVTHPEQIRYIRTDPVNLRVYTYLENPTDLVRQANGISPVPVTIVVHGTNNWNPIVGNIRYIRGGVDNDGNAVADPYDAAPINAPQCPQPGNQMCWSSVLNGSDTVITLRNSPLRSPIMADERGLAPENRLYGLDYIPSPVENLTLGEVQFSTDLGSTQILPKNTARWIITIPNAAFDPVNRPDSVVTVETRIGATITTGVIGNDPANLSRTYFWRGNDAFIYGTGAVGSVPALPITERFQFMGDPRHLPYADLKRPHISAPGVFPPAAIAGPPAIPQGGYESPLGMGYNRYFDDFEGRDPGSGWVYNRGASAEYTGTNVENFTITSGGATPNNVFAYRIDGDGTTRTFTFANGTYTAQGLANALNGSGTFNSRAVADSVSGRLRIISKGRTAGGFVSSVRFVTTFSANAANCANTLGFNNATHTDIAWPGWFYAIGAQQYGIENDGTSGNAGWNGGGDLEIDVHRLFQVLRSGLVRTNAIWTTMTGFSYYYLGIGNEIGYDAANNFDNSIPVSTLPFTGAAGTQYENTITNRVRVVRENNGAGSWFSIPTLGELYPDNAYTADWAINGNLRAGAGALTFIRTDRSNTPTFHGTTLANAVRRTGRKGGTTVFWTGSDASTFHHGPQDGDTSDIQAPGKDIADNYSLPVPDIIDSSRPFDIDYNDPGSNPPAFLQPGAYPPAYTTRILNTYYKHTQATPPASEGSSLVSVTDPVSDDPAFIAVNGLSPSGISGTTFIAKWSFLSLIQSYFNGGLYTDAAANPANLKHVRQVPRIVITAPNDQTNLKNPGTIDIKWDTTWLRWDGLKYTTAAAYNTWYETLTMKYAVIYSPSNGVPDPAKGNPTGWFYVKDGTTPASPGVKPTAAFEVAQPITGPTTTNTVTWSTPGGQYPQGNYLIRVEGYREGFQLHYSYHQYRAFVQR